ncbi:MAG: hypothetical protein K2O49_04695 [Muribaculaceae bacterium]|nr:hypothetical protein [Muribaculaceae bacterium]
MKKLKFIAAFFIGIAGGLVICLLIISLFTDMSLSQFIDKLTALDFMETVMAFLAGIFFFMISFIILIPIHEAGHLIAGLLSGYKFVSFRIFNFVLIKEDGHYRLKRFGIAGTGGQCLLEPPSVPLDRLPVFWYNAGGVLANIVVFILVLPLMWVDMAPLIKEFVFMFLLIDALIILLNGIPMQLGGVGNDGYNLILLRRSRLCRAALACQLRTNSLIQQGLRPRDLPGDLFPYPDEIDYHNPLEVSIPIMKSGIYIDEGKNYDALRIYENLYSHKNEIMPLYVQEIACELIWLRLLAGDKEGAMALLDPEMKKYLESNRRMMSSKERILCAVALLIENDREKADTIYKELYGRKEEYLLQGEVKSDLALMEDLLKCHD